MIAMSPPGSVPMQPPGVEFSLREAAEAFAIRTCDHVMIGERETRGMKNHARATAAAIFAIDGDDRGIDAVDRGHAPRLRGFDGG